MTRRPRSWMQAGAVVCVAKVWTVLFPLRVQSGRQAALHSSGRAQGQVCRGRAPWEHGAFRGLQAGAGPCAAGAGQSGPARAPVTVVAVNAHDYHGYPEAGSSDRQRQSWGRLSPCCAQSLGCLVGPGRSFLGWRKCSARLPAAGCPSTPPSPCPGYERGCGPAQSQGSVWRAGQGWLCQGTCALAASSGRSHPVQIGYWPGPPHACLC